VRFPRLPYTANNKTIKRVIEWGDLNRQAHVADNELTTSTNLSTEHHPFLAPRPSREAVYTLDGTGYALFAAPKLCWVDGTDFIYDDTDEGDVSASSKYMVDFNNAVYIMPDSEYYNYSTDTYGTWGSGTYPADGSVPDMDYMTVLDNRIWGCKTDDIYACALGDATGWTTNDGVSTDSFTVDTGTTGSFTGIVTFRESILLFKEDIVWKLFGDVPANFEYVRINNLGCLNHKSIWEVNGILFYLGRKGVYAYTGGNQPELISKKLNETYVSGIAGGDDRRYYISLYDGSGYKLYTFDTWYNIWRQEDTLQVKDFAYLDGYLYALANDNKIYKFNSGSETVTWTAITKEFTEKINNKKGHSQLNFRVDLEANSNLKVYVRVDNGSWTLKETYTTTDLQSFKVPLKIERADHFQIKVIGEGDGKVHQMTRKFYTGSDA